MGARSGRDCRGRQSGRLVCRRRSKLFHTLITSTNELTHFTAVFSRHDLAANVATGLSCIEAEALAGLLRALGEPATADMWIEQHATDDEPGDARHLGETLEYLVPIDPTDNLRCDSCQ